MNKIASMSGMDTRLKYYQFPKLEDEIFRKYLEKNFKEI
jgi:hypothetical protein